MFFGTFSPQLLSFCSILDIQHFFARFSTHLSLSFTWSLLVLVRAVHHLTQTSTSIFANSSLGLVPHSLSVTSSHQRPSILGSKYVTIKKNRSWLEWIPPLWLECWLLVRMNKFMRFSKAFPPTYTTRPPLSSTYLTYSAHSLILNVVQMYTAL